MTRYLKALVSSHGWLWLFSTFFALCLAGSVIATMTINSDPVFPDLLFGMLALGIAAWGVAMAHRDTTRFLRNE